MTNTEARLNKYRTLARGMFHALILAALGLAIGLTDLTIPATTAQAEATDAVAAQQVPAEVQLRVGETATLENGALRISLVQVSEDNRCPKDVMCVWTGRAVVGLHVVLDGVDRGDVNVTLYPGRRAQPSPDVDATVDRYVISLADLQPYPAASQPQPLDQRVATIHVANFTP